ncbi:MAG TPA: hypothetical protein VIV60_31645, partial [Polyangiaceae bacterium]
MTSTIKRLTLRLGHLLWLVTLWGLGGVVVLVTGLLFSLNLHPLREFIRGYVNQALTDVLVGHIEVDRIGHFNVDGLSGIDAHLLDEHGRRVISLVGLSVRSNWPEIVRSLILSKPLDIKLVPLEVDHAELVIVADVDGTPSVLRALTPKPSTSSPNTSPASTMLSIQKIRLGHCWAHGSLPSVPVIDAELIQLSGAFTSAPSGLSGEVQQVRLVARALPMGLGVSGTINGQIQLPAQDIQPMHASAEFHGAIDTANIVARADIHGNKLTGELRAPAIPATLLQRIAPGIQVSEPVTLDAQVQGELPILDFAANVVQVDTSLSASGKVMLTPETELHCDVTLVNLDLATWAGGLSSTSISSDLHADLVVTEGGEWLGGYRVIVPRGRFGRTDTPALSGDGTLKRTSSGPFEVDGQLRVAEPGATVHTVFSVTLPVDSAPRITAKLTGTLGKPPRLTKMTGLQVSGDVNATADIDLARSRLSADAVLRLAPVLHSHARIRSVRLRVTAAGGLTAPDLTLFADANDIAVSERTIRRLVVDAKGTLGRMQVSATADTDKQLRLALNSRVSIRSGVSIEQPHLIIDDKEGRINVAAQQVSIASDNFRFENVEVTGMGEVQASAVVRGNTVEADIRTHELDLARLAHLFGEQEVNHGLLNLDATIGGTMRNPRGKVRGELRQLAIGEIKGGEVDLDLALADHRVNASVDGTWGDSKLLLSAGELDVPDAVSTEVLLRDLRGEVTLDASLLLAQWAPMLRT